MTPADLAALLKTTAAVVPMNTLRHRVSLRWHSPSVRATSNTATAPPTSHFSRRSSALTCAELVG